MLEHRTNTTGWGKCTCKSIGARESQSHDDIQNTLKSDRFEVMQALASAIASDHSQARHGQAELRQEFQHGGIDLVGLGTYAGIESSLCLSV